jgi:hypothetical protein
VDPAAAVCEQGTERVDASVYSLQTVSPYRSCINETGRLAPLVGWPSNPLGLVNEIGTQQLCGILSRRISTNQGARGNYWTLGLTAFFLRSAA